MHSAGRIFPSVANPRVAKGFTKRATHLLQKLGQPSRLRGRLLFAVFGLILYACALAAREHQAALRRYVAAGHFAIPYSESLRWKDDDEIPAGNGTDTIANLVQETWEQIMTDPAKTSAEQFSTEEILKMDDTSELGAVESAETQSIFAQETGSSRLQHAAQDTKIAEEQKQGETFKTTQDETEVSDQDVGNEKELGYEPMFGEERTGSRLERLLELDKEIGDESRSLATKTFEETKIIDDNTKTKNQKTKSTGVANKTDGSRRMNDGRKAGDTTAILNSNRTEYRKRVVDKEKLIKDDPRVSEKTSLESQPIQGDVMTYEPEPVAENDNVVENNLTAGEDTDILIE